MFWLRYKKNIFVTRSLQKAWAYKVTISGQTCVRFWYLSHLHKKPLLNAYTGIFSEVWSIQTVCMWASTESTPSKTKSGARGLNFCFCLHLQTFSVYESNEDPGNSAHLHILEWEFVTRQCEKYLNLEWGLSNILKEKKKRNKHFDSLQACNVMSVFSANDVDSWNWYVTVKLRQVQRNYRLRMHVGIRVIGLTPVVNCWNMATFLQDSETA